VAKKPPLPLPAATARTVEETILAGEHDDRGVLETRTLLDQRTGLIPVQSRHQHVAEDDVRPVVGQFGQRIETVLGQHDHAASLFQKDLRTPANGVAVVDHHDRQSGDALGAAHFLPSSPVDTDVSAAARLSESRQADSQAFPHRSLPRIKGKDVTPRPPSPTSPQQCRTNG